VDPLTQTARVSFDLETPPPTGGILGPTLDYLRATIKRHSAILQGQA
jgi:hypothetical protein